MPEADFNELLRLSRLYHRESRRARDGKSYLAACVMLAGTLEAGLIGMVHLYHADIPAATPLPSSKGKVLHVLRWDLKDLIRIAAAASWLPAALPEGAEWDGRKARIGDYADWLRVVRNLVHPARYLRDHPRGRITPRYAETAFEVMEAVSSHFYARWVRAYHEREARGEI